MYRYVSSARQVNSGWKEPQGFTKLADNFEKQHKQDLERQSTLDELRRQLEETKLALKKVQKKMKAPKDEDEEQEGEEEEEEAVDTKVLEEANSIIEKAKEFEQNLHTETILGRIQAKTVLDGILSFNNQTIHYYYYFLL